MASLGEHFPIENKRAYIEAALKAGCVVRLSVKFPTITKPKFLVLVSTDDPEYLTFIVNSEINTFIQNRPQLLQCQVIIDVTNHIFLNADSHVACHEVWPIKREEVIRELIQNPSSIKGKISLDVRSRIIAAVKSAKTIDKDKKNRIVGALSSEA